MDRRELIKSIAATPFAGKKLLDQRMVAEEDTGCEHLRLCIPPKIRIGTCFCPDCNRTMYLDEGFNAMFRAFEKRIRRMDSML